VIVGYILAFLAGLCIAKWVMSYGDWNQGLAWERDLLRALNGNLGILDPVMLFMPWLGTNITLLPISIATIVWLVFAHRRYHDAVYLAVVQAGSNTLNPLTKFVLDRARPEVVPRRGWYDWAAYPSGHAIASTAMLLTLCIVMHRVKGWRWQFYVMGPLYVVSLYSRLYLGVHWPTDVLGGMAIGGIWLGFTYYAFKPRSQQ
jgi:membrane-associated phospholipid phosphatase